MWRWRGAVVLNVKHTREAGVIRIQVTGHLDSSTAPMFEKKLEELLQEGGFHVVMACDDLMYISSAGLRVFLSFAKKMKKRNGHMVLVGLQPTVYGVFESSGFLGFLKLCSSMEEAMCHVTLPTS